MENKNIKAFLCSISEYDFMNQLPYCKYESRYIKTCLIEKLGAIEENIVIPTYSGRITHGEYTRIYKEFVSTLCANDVVFIYHSGHGGIDDEYNDLVLYTSNSANLQTGVPSINLTRLLKEQNVSNVVYFLDCCFSGFGVENIEFTSMLADNVFDKFGKGSAVLTSCNKNETSSNYNDHISAFTQFLIDAFNSRFSYKNSYFSLNEFKNSVVIYANAWSKKNPDTPQTPLYVSNMLGTLMLPIEVKQLINNNTNDCYYQGSDFEIYDIKCSKKNRDNETLYTMTATIIINHIIVDDFFVLLKNVVERIKSCKQFLNTNIIFMYIGNDLIDRDDHLYEYRAVWADKQTKYWVGSLGEKALYSEEYSYLNIASYGYCKKIRLGNILPDDSLYSFWSSYFKAIMSSVTTAIDYYYKYRNKDITYEDVCKKHSELANKVLLYCDKAENCPFPHPMSDLKLFDKSCLLLAGDIRELFIYYGQKNDRDEKNRKDCFELFLARYFEDFQDVKDTLPDL